MVLGNCLLWDDFVYVWKVKFNSYAKYILRFKSKVWILRNQVHVAGVGDYKLGMDCCTPRPLLSTFNN
jgi:hypothetical protein